jgi:hypothetical protein
VIALGFLLFPAFVSINVFHQGISTADADGKAMKKPELLERVLKMLNV